MGVIRPRVALGAAAVLAAASLWQFGQAAYIHAKAAAAQYLMLAAWDRSRDGETGARPWPWADTHPVARLRAPGHGADFVILSGASGRTLAFAPGHLDGSALPGQPGNSIIAGHRDTTFRFLKTLAEGDELIVDTPDGGRHTYRVTAAQIVDARKSWAAAGNGRPMLTLVTCFPFEDFTPGGPLRYVVTAEEL